MLPGEPFPGGDEAFVCGLSGQSGGRVDLAGDRPAYPEAPDRTEDRKGRAVKEAQPQELLTGR